MPDIRRAPRTLLIYTLAVPVFVVVYMSAFGSRIWGAIRLVIATLLGATVIGSVYADEALKRAPATPMRAAAMLALAIVLVAPAVAPAPTAAAADPAEAVIAAAREFVGSKYRLGTEGPRTFDCSGLVFRAFADAGELPRISGMRLRAAGYMRWFVSRGLFTRDVDEAERGDLVIYDKGGHIGIYVGDGKVLSALTTGVAIHRLHVGRADLTYFLKVDWRNGGGGDGPGDDDPGDGDGKPGKGDNEPPPGNDPPRDGAGNGNNGNGNGNNAGADQNGNGKNNNGRDPVRDNTPKPDRDKPTVAAPTPDRANNNPRNGRSGLATGTLNMRLASDPAARIIGWVSRGSTFKIIAEGMSPAGYLWYQVETVGGKQGWIWAHWTRVVE